jgi:hypothetical protein
MIKVTDCTELENLAEFYIFIKDTALGGDSKMRKVFPILMMNLKKKNIRSNDHFSKKSIRSNELSVFSVK